MNYLLILLWCCDAVAALPPGFGMSLTAGYSPVQYTVLSDPCHSAVATACQRWIW